MVFSWLFANSASVLDISTSTSKLQIRGEEKSFSDLQTMLAMQTDIFSAIAAFLSPRAVSSASRCCKLWLQHFGSDAVWRRVVQQRWGLQTHLAKQFGGLTWRAAYQNLALRMRPPRGKLSHKYNLVTARGRRHGVDLWATLGHTNDCRMRTHTTGDGRVCRAVELRLIVQNVHNNSLHCDMRHIRVLCKPSDSSSSSLSSSSSSFARPSSEPQLRVSTALNAMEPLSSPQHPAVLALDGRSTDSSLSSSSTVTLRPLSFAVLSVLIETSGCEFESDFLARGLCVEVPVTLRKDAPSTAAAAAVAAAAAGSTHDHQHEHTSSCCCCAKPAARDMHSVHAYFMDEQKIWDYYEQLPGGCMVLHERRADGL
jgi:hypothetical protein